MSSSSAGRSGAPAYSSPGLYFAAFSLYCLANFARCREAHCIVTGVGWGILAIVALDAALFRLDWFGPIWNAFLIVFVMGHGFELIWARVRHTHGLRVGHEIKEK